MLTCWRKVQRFLLLTFRIGGKGLVEVATIYKGFKLSLINALTQEGIGIKQKSPLDG